MHSHHQPCCNRTFLGIQETILSITEYSEAAITVRGTYFPPGETAENSVASLSASGSFLQTGASSYKDHVLSIHLIHPSVPPFVQFITRNCHHPSRRRSRSTPTGFRSGRLQPSLFPRLLISSPHIFAAAFRSFPQLSTPLTVSLFYRKAPRRRRKKNLFIHRR